MVANGSRSSRARTPAKTRSHAIPGDSGSGAPAPQGTSPLSDELIVLAGTAPPRRPPPRRPPRRRQSRAAQAVREVIDTLDGTVQGIVERGQLGSLEERDPVFIAQQVRWLGPLSDIYFRGEVRHLDRIPAKGPVLCVGNHSGGLLTPDTWVLLVNYFRHFGPDRLSYALAHNMVMGMPIVGQWLRKVGTLPAHPDYAREALRRDAVVLVYPGGDQDVFRSWRDRNRIRLAHRTGFVRLALQERVPIVPLVSVGGHETTLVLGDGRKIAQAIGADRFRIKSLPLVVGPPWGVSPGDLLLHAPLPAKITVEVGEPIDFEAEFGRLDPRDSEVVWACYRLVEHRMQTRLDALAAERRLPIIG